MMSKIGLCSVCDNIAVLEFSEKLDSFGTYRLYCSTNCRSTISTKNLEKIITMSIVVYVLFLIILLPKFPQLFIYAIIGMLGIVIFVQIFESVQSTKVRRHPVQNIYNYLNSNITRPTNLVFSNPSEFVYSQDLEKEVRICCHQSARLRDQYCLCGRGLEYPAES